MYVAVTGRGKSRVIQFCEQHRIPGTKKKKTIVIRTLGNYEKMLEKNPNILVELKEEIEIELQVLEEEQIEMENMEVIKEFRYRRKTSY